MSQTTISQRINEAVLKINACHFECEGGELHLNANWHGLLESISAIEAHVTQLQTEAKSTNAQLDLLRDVVFKAYEWAAAHRLGIGFTVPDLRTANVVYDACREALGLNSVKRTEDV